ncbi:hypothetical protein BCS98_15315 [Vibrio breoganii]|uniref:sulfotransferase family 2 domain-containing protein n=1 Tax=Vibrio breoganii TaxID=553239 RepID=UPI000C840CAE|nr:sulfotransferase family 2 domain-containing protein [Vibrio breoganii]PMO90161.1 hypothetical protein BCS98_15315 [Vibrio breoganii]
MSKMLKVMIRKFLDFIGLESKYKNFKLKRIIISLRDKREPLSSIRNNPLYNSSNEKIIFIHIPKAAGMSVVKTIYGNDYSHHSTALEYINEDFEKFNKAFVFSISRNPYTRLISAYNYLKSGGMNPIDRIWHDIYIKDYETFESFVMSGGLEHAIECNAEHFIPQYKFVCDLKGNVLCNHLGKLEQLSATEASISSVLNRDVKFDLINKHSEKKLVLSEYYNKNMLDKVNHLYMKDFEIFNYEMLEMI